MYGKGHIFLQESLEKLLKQTFKDFEVVISDFSQDTVIKELCKTYDAKLELHYFKNTNPIVGMSTNTNNAFEHARGKIIKLIFQDDFLYSDTSLAEIVENFDLEKDHWLVTACEHTEDGTTFIRPFYPTYNKLVVVGNNTIGAPSVMAIKNEGHLLFDPNLRWLTDCDYYYRCYNQFGLPKIVSTITTVIRTGDHQITNTEATTALRQKELDYVVEKFDLKKNWNYKIWNAHRRIRKSLRQLIMK